MVTGLRLAGRRLSNFIRPNVIVTSVPPDIHADWNVPVKVRDGTTLRVNVFRPSEAGAYPVIMSAHPYGKDRIPARSRSGRTPQSAASGGNLPLGGLQRSLPRLRSARRFAGRRFQHSMEQADRQDCPPARRSSAGDLCTSRTRRMVSIKNAEYRTHPSADARLRQFLGSFPAFARLLRAFPSRGIETEVALHAPRRKMVDLLQPTGDGRSHRFFDHFLKGAANGWAQRPSVHLEVHDDGPKPAAVIQEDAWPPANLNWRPLWLDSRTMALGEASSTDPSEAAFSSRRGLRFQWSNTTPICSSAAAQYRRFEPSVGDGP